MTTPFCPTHLRIGPFTYQVRIDEAAVNKASVEAGSNYGGFSDHEHHLILLRPDVSEDSRRETLIHEIIHCIHSVTGFSYRLALDAKVTKEEIAQAEAPTWLGVLRDNPHLVEWLMGH